MPHNRRKLKPGLPDYTAAHLLFARSTSLYGDHGVAFALVSLRGVARAEAKAERSSQGDLTPGQHIPMWLPSGETLPFDE